MKTKLTIIIGMFFVGIAVGCDTNYDCGYGQTCMKQSPYSPGVCIGGQQYLPPVQQQQGQSCWSDITCGIGGRCIKSGYNSVGRCQ